MAFLKPSKSVSTLPPWRILLVDDEPDIHEVTTMALSRFVLDERSLFFLHAYSGAEAREILAREKDIALVLLDVVMESETAGLETARWLRQEQGNRFTRIVLRTGQPGQAPEEEVIVEYDINDYKEKTELDRKKLFTTLFAALRAYRDISQIETARLAQLRYQVGLEKVISASTRVFESRNLREFANGLLQQVVALLRLDEQSILVRVKGVSAIPTENQMEVLASIGDIAPEDKLDPGLMSALMEAQRRRTSILEDDTYVGYFSSKGGKATLLVLKGVTKIDQLDSQLLDIFSSSVGIAFENLLLNQEIVDTQSELINRLGNLVESRSQEMGNHVKRIAELSHMLALSYGLPPEEAEIIRRAAPMHDIGKIATPDSVLLKPGELTEEEWEVMKQHPVVGHKLLEGSNRPILQAAAIICHEHHERFDGSGYPRGLVGKSIHAYARIVAVADVFDALSHQRVYKPAWAEGDVIEYVKKVAGSHLDPEIVDLLLTRLDTAKAIRERFPD
ncbi:DUF3369 domain-containing protein [Burkholderiaceae bacterium DAT-1]|nr:DUF3369 domain-containing protein [Burkholderiaceae bacterium DAT-1]